MKNFYGLFYGAIVTLFVSCYAEVPSYIKICGRKDPNLDQCILNSVKGMTGKLKAGIPELDVPSADPLFIDQVPLADLPNFKASAKNITLYGLSEFIVKNLHVDLVKMQINVELIFQKIGFDADYHVNARILVPISGTGPIHMITDDVLSKVVMKYNLVQRNGKKYMFFATMTTKLTVGDYTAKFDPADGPNSTLAMAINNVLANSRRELIDGTTPNLEKAISTRILFMANKLCKHFTYDELFPDRE